MNWLNVSRKRRYQLILILGTVILLASIIRLYNIDWSFSNNGIDEGIMLERSLLIDRGFGLYSDISCDQAPFWLYIGALFEGDVLSTRAFNAVISIFAILACMEFSRRFAGNAAMAITGLLLAFEFAFVRESRLFSLDGASSFFLAFSLLTFFFFIRKNGNMFLFITGIFLGLSTAAKLHGAIALIGILIFLFIERSRKEEGNTLNANMFGLLLIGFVVPILVFFIALGPTDMLNGMLFNQTHREFDPYLKLSIPAFFAVSPAYIIPLVVAKKLWNKGMEIRFLLCVVVTLLIYMILQPLIFFHHMVLLSPPLAILAGIAFCELSQNCNKLDDKEQLESSSEFRLSPKRIFLVLVISSIVISGAFSMYGLMMQKEPNQSVYGNMLREITDEGEYVIAGDPLIAAYAARPTPPNVVNVAYRVYPQLTTEDIMTAVGEYNVTAVVVCYRLNEMNDLPDELLADGFVKISPDIFEGGYPGVLDLFQDGIEPISLYVRQDLAEEHSLPISSE